LDIYIRQIATFRDHSWSKILGVALEENKKVGKTTNASTISAFRENLYIPSSSDKPY